MRLAQVLFCTLLLSLPLAATAKKEKTAAPKQFIDRSVVVYPTSAPGLSFVDRSYSAENWPSGVGLHYRIDDAPEIRFDVFVYPTGRSPEAAAVEQSMAEVKAAIEDAAQKNTYTSVVFGESVDFPIATMKDAAESESEATSVVPTPNATTPVTAKAGDSSSLDARVLALFAEHPFAGRKLAIGFDLDGKPRQSLAYTFYKQLFLFKIRITADTALMNPVQFNALADAAARALIPAITVHNEGQCGNIVIATDAKSKDADDAAYQLMSGMVQVKKENCAASLGPNLVPAGSDSETIVYPDATWKSN